MTERMGEKGEPFDRLRVSGRGEKGVG